MADPNELNPNLKVRDLIFAFEHQTQDEENDQYEEEIHNRPKLKRTKSLGNALSYKLFRQPKVELYDILDIEKEVVKIETHLNYYEIYDKETHVAFQEQLFDILTNIVNIDTERDPNLVEKKKKLIEDTQNLARQLNQKLPFDNNLRKVGRKTYTVTVKKEEAVVAKNETHFVKLTQEKDIINHNSNITNNNLSVKNLNVNSAVKEPEAIREDTLKENLVPIETKVPEAVDAGFLPSVKKLKDFFSFRKSNDDEDFKKSKSTNVSRSSSMLWKTKYALEENNKVQDVKADLQIKNIEEDNKENISKNEDNSDKEEIYEEEAIDVEPVKESTVQQDEITHSISVNKLKKLFEEEKQDNTQGLEIFLTSQPMKLPETGVVFTAMNLGAFRLKRSLSGQYMNQIGLLSRNSLASKSVGDITTLIPRKDSLVINKFGNIENEIDEDEEEERMPSLDYNGGISSLGYEVNIPEPIQEKEDKQIHKSLVEPQVELYKEKVEFNMPKVHATIEKEEPTRIISEPVLQVYDGGILSTANNAEHETNKKVQIENRAQELMNILESTKSFSTITSDSSLIETKAISKEEIVANMQNLTELGKSELTQNSVTQQKTHVTRVSTHKVHSLVTSFERQISESDQKEEVSFDLSKEDSIPAQHSPTSPYIVQSIISSIEKRKSDSPTPIVEEPTSFSYDANDKIRFQNHSVIISEVPATPEIEKEDLSEDPSFEKQKNTSIDIQTNDAEETKDSLESPKDNDSFIIIESHQNVLENGVNKSKSNVIIEKHTSDDKSATHSIKSQFTVIQEHSVNGEGTKVSNTLNENHIEHVISDSGDTEIIKVTNIVAEEHNQHVANENFEKNTLVNKVTQNQDEHVVSTNVTENGTVESTKISYEVTASQTKYSTSTEITDECIQESTVVENAKSDIGTAKENTFTEKLIIDNLFRNADLDVDNIDEEFEKLLKENH